MNADPVLLLRFAFAMLLMAAGVWVLARQLGKPLTRWALVGGLLLPCAVLAPWIGGGDLLVPASALRGLVPGTNMFAEKDAHGIELNDVVYQFLPWELEVRHSLAAGRLPLWSDFVDGGSSPWVNLQAAVASPIAMAARLAPLQHHLLLSLMLKLLVAFTGAWVLARAVGVGRGVALVAGAAWSLSGAFAAWGLFPHSGVSAWTPWLAAAAIGVVRRPGRERILIAALVAAIVLVGGHPEGALASGVFAAFVSFLYRRRGERAGWREGALAWLRLGLACVAGAALTAPILIPFAAAVRDSQRAATRVGGENRGTATAAEVESPGWFGEGRVRLFSAAIHPHALGRPYVGTYTGPPNLTVSVASAHYAGMVAWVGALVGLGLAWRRVGPILGFAAALIALAADFRPFAALAGASEWSRAIEWTRLLSMGALALALAGAIGFERLVRSRGRRRTVGWAAAGLAIGLTCAVRLDSWTAALALAMVVAIVAMSSNRIQVAGLSDRAVTTAWFSRRAVTTALVSRRAGIFALAFVAAVELGAWFVKFMPRGAPGDFYPRTAAVEAIRREARGRRVIGHDYLAYPATLAVFGIADPRPHNPLAPAAQVASLTPTLGFSFDDHGYHGAVRNPTHPFASFLDVGLVVSNEYLPALEGWREVPGPWSPWRLWATENPASGIAFLASGVDIVAAEDLARSLAALVDPRRAVLVREQLGVDTASIAGHADDSLALVRVVRRRPGRFRVDFDLRSSAAGRSVLLATSLPSPAGWSASDHLSGKPLRRFAVHGAFAGFALPGGTAGTIDLAFSPPGLRTGWWIFALTAATLLVANWPRKWRTTRLAPRVAASAFALVALGVQGPAIWPSARAVAPKHFWEQHPELWMHAPHNPARREFERGLRLAARRLPAGAVLRVTECRDTAEFAATDEAFYRSLWAGYLLPELNVLPARSAAVSAEYLLCTEGERRGPRFVRLARNRTGETLYRVER